MTLEQSLKNIIGDHVFQLCVAHDQIERLTQQVQILTEQLKQKENPTKEAA